MIVDLLLALNCALAAVLFLQCIRVAVLFVTSRRKEDDGNCE
jgi:hypothetical protein